MKVYMVRHGQTDYNLNNLLQGKSNIPLNSKGIEQANILKEKIKNLKIEHIYSSSLDRAVTTANIINSEFNLPINIENDLVERSFGILEGVEGSQYDIDLFWDYECDYKYKDVESVKEFLERINNFYERLYKKHKDENILIVAHNGVNIATYCYFNGIPEDNDLLKIKLDNCECAEYEK